MIKVTKEVTDIFPQYRPKVGKIYEAELSPAKLKKYKNTYGGKPEFCIVDILDKKIVLRTGEYEIVGI
jgi:hypothetical protein